MKDSLRLKRYAMRLSFVCLWCSRKLYLLLVLTSMVVSYTSCLGCAPVSRQACLDWSWAASRDLWESFTSQLSSTREPPHPTPTPPHICTYTQNAFPSLVSLLVSVRLEEACCYTITHQSTLWQGILYHPPPPPFPQETGIISGVPLHSSQLHKLFVLIFWDFCGCSGLSGKWHVGRREIPHLRL